MESNWYSKICSSAHHHKKCNKIHYRKTEIAWIILCLQIVIIHHSYYIWRTINQSYERRCDHSKFRLFNVCAKWFGFPFRLLWCTMFMAVLINFERVLFDFTSLKQNKHSIYKCEIRNCERRYEYARCLHNNVWIIYFQNFEPVMVPAKEAGKFFTGDSYIILNVSCHNDSLGNGLMKNVLFR